MSDTQKPQKRTYWFTAPELPEAAFEAWRKPDAAISPVAIVATVDPDGSPRAVPVEEVKNDMAYRIVIESAIEISAREEHKGWYEAAMRELEAV